jgi:UDP-N-acetylglucosamine--N-acetylmuramyl-(pentapeptide) pyrophosphoryl-undecaprenol N-acetylglucosamine transferase
VSDERYALVAGGGTAGHLQPALAIAEALVDRGHERSSIEFVGSRRGQDGATLEGRGFPFTLLPGRGLTRSFRPADLARNVGAVGELAVAGVRALAVVARARPRVVVSVGGYASLPASLAAVVLRAPLVLVNVDAVPGAANRLLGRFAKASAVGWEGCPLPRATVTGTPVRPEIAAVRRQPDDRQKARRALGLSEDRAVVAAFGGSLGARRINDAVAGLVGRWAERRDVAVYHVVGRRDWSTARWGQVPLRGEPESPEGIEVVAVPYEDHMDRVYAAADVVVCRAGAMTVAELAAAGVPSVLVPLPGAPGDHQTANARMLERAGAAVLLPDAACDPVALERCLDRLLGNPSLLSSMAEAAGGLGRPAAAAEGARVVDAEARGASPRGTHAP